jgi:5-methylcytosine-specific restriction endonuclease McrA
MDAALEELVHSRARFRCEYCLLPEALASTPFQIDHIIAQSHGGQTIAENLAFACFHCNNFKGPNVAGIDPQTGRVSRLFHPRRDLRRDHFRWDNETLIGITAVGRATIVTLRLNHPLRLAIRRSLLQEGVRFA